MDFLEILYTMKLNIYNIMKGQCIYKLKVVFYDLK